MKQFTLATYRRRLTLVLRGSLLFLATLLIRERPSAQTFSSGSDGRWRTDGAGQSRNDRAQFTFPFGFSRVLVRATWTQ